MTNLRSSTRPRLQGILAFSCTAALFAGSSSVAQGQRFAPAPVAAEAGAQDSDMRADRAAIQSAVQGHPITRPRLSNLQPSAADRVIDERVRRLTRVLGLDEMQQARLKELLVSERREIRKAWTENSRPEADRTGPTLAILDRTREQIRAMLNEEQKKQYPAAVPRSSMAPAHADPEYWLRLTQPAQRETE